MFAAKDVEPGYEADAEQETGHSDVSCKESATCVTKCRKTREKPKRRTDTAERYILYPSMCEQLIYFIENGSENTV